MVRHEYGGQWTRLKLDILKDYLQFYTTALKGQPFTLHYVDAFAGTGKQDLKLLGENSLLILLLFRSFKPTCSKARQKSRGKHPQEMAIILTLGYSS